MGAKILKFGRDILTLFIEEIQDYRSVKKNARKLVRNEFNNRSSENSRPLQDILTLD